MKYHPYTLLLVVLLFYACGDSDLRVQCDNLLPSAQTKFIDVYALLSSSGPSGCATCHAPSNPNANYDFLTKPGVYEALSNHFDVVYAQIASGRMPEDGTPWSESNIQILRSWYCYGGPYEP
ncbi:MAG: hypothetical protein KDK51_06185 [Deltaproteobacteria bacterium]|nr:hypothetical protein [Deltaproteobacteria bacterium]